MKIMIVTPYFYPQIGGLENYALQIALGLQRDHGHDVLVVTTDDHDGGPVTEPVGAIRIIRLSRSFKISNTPVNPLWYLQLRSLIRREQPDVINAHTPVPYIADMAIRAAGAIPTVLTYHGDTVQPSLVKGILAKLSYTFMSEKTLRRANRIIATTEHYVTISPHLGRHRSKVAIVSPGVDLAIYNDRVDRTWLRDRHPQKHLLLFVGNLRASNSYKGVDVLIRAFAQVRAHCPDCTLVVVGQGDATDAYRTLARELDIEHSVVFTGFVPPEDLPYYYAGADACILPSVTAAEGFGMVLLEAQACGTPVIGSDIGGIPVALVDQRSGLLVPPNSVPDLRDAILKMLDPDLNARFGRYGADTVAQQLSWPRQVAATDEILRRELRPRVVQVTARYPPCLGGMEAVAQTISQRLAARHYEVDVLTSRTDSINPIDVDPSGPDALGSDRVHRLRSFDLANVPIIPGLFWHLLRARRPVIIHVHVSQAFIPEIAVAAAKLRRQPVVLHFHLDVAPSGRFGRLFSLYKRTVFPVTLRAADRVIVLSDAQGRLVQDKYGVEASRISVVRNGVDEAYRRQDERELPDIPTILFVGRLTAQKNVGQLLEALDGISDRYRTHIVGDGELAEALARKASRLGLANVTFDGELHGSDLWRHYDEADVFVLPSEKEGMPLVLLEAMGMGLPVVATDVTGNRELVTNNGNGFLVPLGDASALRRAIVGITTDRQLYKRLSAGSRQAAERYSWAAAMEEIEAVYANVFSRR